MRGRFTEFDAAPPIRLCIPPSAPRASAAPPIGSSGNAAIGGSALLPPSAGRGPFAGGAGSLFGGFSGLLGGVSTDSTLAAPRPAARPDRDGGGGGGSFARMGAVTAAAAAPAAGGGGIGGGGERAAAAHATLAPSTAAAAAFVPAPHVHAHAHMMQQQQHRPLMHAPPVHAPAHVTGYMRGPASSAGPYGGFAAPPVRPHPPQPRAYGCYCGKPAVYVLQPCAHPQCESCCRVAVARSACTYCGYAVAGVVELPQ